MLNLVFFIMFQPWTRVKLITTNSSKQKLPQNLAMIALFSASSPVHFVASRNRGFSKMFQPQGTLYHYCNVNETLCKALCMWNVTSNQYTYNLLLNVSLFSLQIQIRKAAHYVKILSMEDENLIHSSEQAKVVLSGNFALNVKSLPLS